MVYLQSLEEWLPTEEHKLASMKPLSPDNDILKDQIEELKVCIHLPSLIYTVIFYTDIFTSELEITLLIC